MLFVSFCSDYGTAKLGQTSHISLRKFTHISTQHFHVTSQVITPENHLIFRKLHACTAKMKIQIGVKNRGDQAK